MSVAHSLLRAEMNDGTFEIRLARLVKFDGGVPVVVLHGTDEVEFRCKVLRGARLPLANIGAGALGTCLIAVPGGDGSPIFIGEIVDELSKTRIEKRNDDLANKSVSEELKLDANRLVLDASQEVVIRCGASEIRMGSDGKVTIKGRDFTARASRTNRIKGATVRIN